MSRVRRETIQAMCGPHLATEPSEDLKIWEGGGQIVMK